MNFDEMLAASETSHAALINCLKGLKGALESRASLIEEAQRKIAAREKAVTEREEKIDAREKSIKDIRELLAQARCEKQSAIEDLVKESKLLEQARKDNGVLKGQIIDLQRALKTLPITEEHAHHALTGE